MMRTIHTPPDKHYCDVQNGPQAIQHWIAPGTVVECDECGQRWKSEPYPKVSYGQQMVGNHWVRIHKPFWRKRRAAVLA